MLYLGGVQARPSPAIGAVADLSVGLSVERFQKEIVRGTFRIAQGRQWLQICCLDAIFRMLRERGQPIDWALLGSPAARARMRKRSLPPGHVAVDGAEVAAVFELWLQVALWVGQYVYHRDCSWLPTDRRLDAFVHERFGLPSWASSSTEEELAGMKVMFERYRRHDPGAGCSAEQMLWEFVLPFWIKGDRHWVSGARLRPGVLADPHASMIRHLVVASHNKRARGWALTASEALCARVGDLLARLETIDPRYRSLPAYRQLIDEYNQAHPGAEVDCLHR